MAARPGVKYQISHRKGLTLRVHNGIEIFEDEQTGGMLIGRGGQWNEAINDYDFRLEEIRRPDGWVPNLNTPWGKRMFNFYPKTIPLPLLTEINRGGPGAWNYDNKRDTSGPGGARRNLISVPLAMILAGHDDSGVWLQALIDWNKDQFNRPASAVPFDLCGDQFSARKVLCNTPRERDLSSAFQLGWNLCDEQHADYAHQYALACLDHPWGIVNCFLAGGRFLVPSTNNFTGTNWRRATRGMGHILAWCIIGKELGFGEYGSSRADLFRGFDYSEAPERCVEIMISLIGDKCWPGSILPDGSKCGGSWPRDFPQIEVQDYIFDGVSYGPQIRGRKPGLDGLYLWPYMWYRLHPLMDSSYKDRLDQHVFNNCDSVYRLNWRSNAGMSFIYGTTEMTLAAANDLASRSGWFTHQTRDGTYIVDDGAGSSRNYDSALIAAPMSLYDVTHGTVVDYQNSTEWGQKPQYELVMARGLEIGREGKQGPGGCIFDE